MQSVHTFDGGISSIVAAANRFAARFAMRGICEAEDIAQDALVKVLAKKDLTPPSSGWLYKVVRNVAYDAGRKHLAKTKYLSRFAACDGSVSVCELADEDGQVHLAGRHGEPADGNEIDVELLAGMLKKLSPVLRQVLVLFAEGYSYLEIAELTGANIGTVRSRLHYARKRARQILEDAG
jgi:RNA polymerase sigma-70 factor (ECF subfamily)